MPDEKRTPCAPCRARRPARRLSLLVALGATVASAPLLAAAQPAVVHGKVAGWEKLLPAVYVDAAKNDAHRYTWREPSPTVKQEFRRLSASVSRDVCVVAFDTSPPQPHEPISVKLTGGRFTPATLVVSPGTRLSFRNADPFPHMLYEEKSDKWTASPTGPGSTREWAAGAAGLHVIRDQLFESVVMYVLVDPAAVELALPDRDGTFSMSLPPGDYTLKAFFDGKQVGKEASEVHVGDHGTVELHEPMALGGDAK